MALILITDATVEPTTVAEAKAFMRVDIADDDTLIGSLIKAARTDAEKKCGRSLIETIWEHALDAFPSGSIELPRVPVLSVTSVKYDDEDGVEQTLDASAYRVDTHSAFGRVEPAYGTSWPSARRQANAVRVRFKAGYGTAASSVPAPIVQWIKIRVAQLYEHREQVITGAAVAIMPFVDGLLDGYRLPDL